MKKIFTVIAMLCSLTSFSQYGSASWPEFFFGRQPSARAEAMGKSYVAIDGDLATVHFNPAGISSISNLEFNYSHTPPNYYFTKGYYTFYAFGYKQSKYLQLALSHFRFDFGRTQVANATKTPFTETYTLTLSSEPINKLFVGANARYFVWQPGIDRASTTLYFDFGLLKKIPLSKGRLSQSVNIGASIQNLNCSHIDATFNGTETRYELPVITRYGASYRACLGNHFFLDSSSTFQMLVQSEYQDVLNSKHRSAIKVAAELLILEILAVRTGYYSESVDNFGFPDNNKSKIESITYGLGLQLPLYKKMKIPLQINLDYTSLPQVNHSIVLNDAGKFSTYSVRLSFISKKTKNYR